MNTYYFSGSLAALQAFIAEQNCPNLIGPAPGRAEVPASTVNGMAFPAIPAAGDPSLYYVSFLTNSTITPPTGVLEDDANGRSVLGVWA